MLGIIAAVVALVPEACPWATNTLPRGADMRLGDPSFFHGPDLLGVAFSPDGGKIATANASHVTVHDAETGRRLWSAKASWRGRSLAVHPDGKRVAWVNDDRCLTVFDVAAGKKVREIARPDLFNFNGRVAEVAFTRDGTGVIGDYQYRGHYWMIDTLCWDIGTGARRWHLPFTNLTFSADGKTVFARSPKFAAFDAMTGAERRAVPEQPRQQIRWLTSEEEGKVDVRSPVLSGDRSRIAFMVFSLQRAGPHPMEVRDTADGTRIRVLPPPKDGRRTPQMFSPSGRYLWTTDGDGSALRWDLKPPKAVCFDRARMWAELGGPNAGVAYAAAGRMLDGTQWGELAKRFPPERAADAKAVAEPLARLSDRDYATREAASAELLKLGTSALPALRAFLKVPPNEEARRRAEKAIRALTDDTSPVALARARIVAAVAMAATDDPAARKQLQAWAAGDTGLPLTEAARAALTRLPE